MSSEGDVFDRIEIEQDDGTVRSLDHPEYAAIPMLDRIQLLLAGRVRFFKGADQIPASVAMKGLREAKSRTTSG